MKSMLLLLATTAGTLTFNHVTVAQAAEWLPRLECENQKFVIDGLHSFERGFSDHQLVIRKADAVAHLKDLVGHSLATNAEGEIVKQNLGSEFFGSPMSPIEVELARNYTSGSGTELFWLQGSWVGASRYKIDVKRKWCGPGSCSSSGETIGNWVFNDCRTLR